MFLSRNLSYVPVLVNGLRSGIATRMVKVQACGTVAYLLWLYAIVYKPFAQLPVLPTILHPFIKTVDANNIFFPA